MPTLLLVWFFWRVRNEDRLVSLCQSQACYPVRSTSSRAPRLQGRGWDASKEGVHEKGECAQESTTVPTMDKIWHRVRTWCCPQSRKEGKKVSLWEMRLLHWGEWVYRNLPLAAWGYSTAVEESGSHALCLKTHPDVVCLLRPHTAGEFLQPVG